MIQSLLPTAKAICAYTLLFAIPLVSPPSGEKKMKMLKKVEAMKEEIEKQIWVGSSIQSAKKTMERNGFKCIFIERGSFAEMADEERFVRRHDNADFLYCDKEKGGFICSRRWQVAIVHHDGIVSDIFVSISQTCP